MECHSTLLVVKNLEESLDFYVNTLGISLIEHHGDSAMLMAGRHKIVMFEGSAEAVEYKHGQQANSTLLFAVNDLDKKVNQLKSKNVVFVHQMPNQNRWGRYSAFRDPSGIVHELVEYF
ncbi:Catechol 2,3-dioxygenase [Reichenbachiella faecimaris]|uniref:Catechol 2,3-dioxygenase n=1 Tax=Reichenbachiella faecimaris TaxID=692418 RepID=A0A1W2G843_REIFA|nr:VOC family protein [Reichenbachiella faecimaris]SMD32456.1 Catechol 2,3-dioxygenase [Reichenbachiella faecimaris]